jgi:hypothetical protein
MSPAAGFASLTIRNGIGVKIQSSISRSTRAATGAWQLSSNGWRFLVLLVVAAPLLLTGCSGCRDSSSEADDQEKQQEDEIADFTIGELETLTSRDELKRNFVKPGHFVSASLPATANKFDFQGELETLTIDNTQTPTVIVDTSFHITSLRPALLPKGQTKYLESTYFIPRDTGRGSEMIFLQNRLRAIDSSQHDFESTQVTNRMPPYQYILVVLAANPNAYSYLNQLPSVSPPYDETMDDEELLPFYQVALPTVEQRAPIPSHPFAWTGIAYLLWDGIHPNLLTPAQQEAMLDWLHWGGQLIVSGPSTLELLRGSFLDSYLSYGELSSVILTNDQLEELNENWSLTRLEGDERLTLTMVEDQTLRGVKLTGEQSADCVPGTGCLVTEYRVGRGRIVVTAFPLSNREVINWGSFDSFFNGCLLHRPPRQFVARDFGSPRMQWRGISAAIDDPRLSTSTRYFSRDAAPLPGGEDDEDDASLQYSINDLERWHFGGYRAQAESGIAGWDDTSGAASAARRALREAAGISIPDANFVFRSMSIYLLILIPVNWCVFRLLGRVEWAWFAVPILAILGAIIVIRQAQLDIGFARSRTEVAILEIQGGYPRGHLTRYTALYNSLASSYELRFENPAAVARPMLGTSSPTRDWELIFRREDNAVLSRFQVISNTTGFVHSEQMLDLGGSLRLFDQPGRDMELRNSSEMQFQNVGLLHRTTDGTLRSCWVGEVPPKSNLSLNFRDAVRSDGWIAEWQSQSVQDDQQGDRQANIQMEGMLRLAATRLDLRSGDVRLIGWTDDEMAGLTIRPTGSQSLVRTLVVAHLQYGALPAPQPDNNLLVDVQQESPDADDALEIFGNDPTDTDESDAAANQEQP